MLIDFFKKIIYFIFIIQCKGEEQLCAPELECVEGKCNAVLIENNSPSTCRFGHPGCECAQNDQGFKGCVVANFIVESIDCD